MICAFCGEREAAGRDNHDFPICSECQKLPEPEAEPDPDARMTASDELLLIAAAKRLMEIDWSAWPICTRETAADIRNVARYALDRLRLESLAPGGRLPDAGGKN